LSEERYNFLNRVRRLDDLENAESLAEKISIERFISEIDNSLVQLFSKMILSGKLNLEPTVNLEEINEEEIKDFARSLVKKRNFVFKSCSFSEEDIQYEIIKLTKCDMDRARKFFHKMMNLGLELCKDEDSDYDTHNLQKFCIMREYVSKDELPTPEK